MKHLRSFSIAALALVLTFAGCAAAPAAEQSAPFLTATDMTGRGVSLEKPAKSVVALDAASCEILYAVGAGDMLIGRGEYCDYPAEALSVPSVESGYEADVERIIELDPDVMFMSKMGQTKEQAAALENAGIAVVVCDAQDIDGVYASIELIGRLVGRDDEAAAVIEDMRSSFAGVAGAFEGQTVYFEVSPLEYGLWTAGSGTFMNEIAELLGLQNCFGDVEGWAEISEEQVIERDPDYIVTAAMYFGEGPTPEQEIMGRVGWEGITAVKQGAVLNLGGNELSRPGPRLAKGAKLLNDFIPEYSLNAA